MKNTNDTSFSLSELKIPVPGNNPIVQFMKQNRLYLFLGIIVISLVALAFIPTSPSVVRTQLNVSENNTLTVPTEDTSSIPVVVSDTNENENDIGSGSLLSSLNENTNDQNLASETNTNSDVTVLHPSTTEENVGNVGYEGISGVVNENVNGSASLAENNAKSGPETFVILFFSLIVSGVFYVVKRRVSLTKV